MNLHTFCVLLLLFYCLLMKQNNKNIKGRPSDNKKSANPVTAAYIKTNKLRSIETYLFYIEAKLDHLTTLLDKQTNDSLLNRDNLDKEQNDHLKFIPDKDTAYINTISDILPFIESTLLKSKSEITESLIDSFKCLFSSLTIDVNRKLAVIDCFYNHFQSLNIDKNLSLINNKLDT